MASSTTLRREPTRTAAARPARARSGVARLLALWALAAAGVAAVLAEVLVALVAVLGGTDGGSVLTLGARTLPVAAVAALALLLLRRRGH